MSLNSIYTRTSLLAIFFISIHYTDDVLRKVRGLDQGGFMGLLAVLILVVWLFAILMLNGRKSGYIINLIIGLLNALIPLGHLTGMAGEATLSQIAAATGPFFGPIFVWVVFAIALTLFPALFLSAYLLFRPTAEKPATSVK